MRFGTYRLRKRLEPKVIPHSGFLARRIRHPNPLDAPWRAEALELRRNAGLGDVLMSTPALREVKRLNRRCRIRLYTDFGDLVRGLPYIDDVQPSDAAPAGAIYLEYETAIPPRVHTSRIIGDVLGVNVRNTRPDCIVQPELVARFRQRWDDTVPTVVILRQTSRWTPNKHWPAAHWRELLQRLRPRCRIVEIGEAPASEEQWAVEPHEDLRGATTLSELAAVVAAADLYVGPDSGPMHIARAVGTRAVVIFGGYTHPKQTGYRGHTTLYTELACAPCWLRSPCPYQRKCLTAITPERVEAAVRAALRARSVAVGWGA